MYPDTPEPTAIERRSHCTGLWTAWRSGLEAVDRGRHNCAAVAHPAFGGAAHRITHTRERT